MSETKTPLLTSPSPKSESQRRPRTWAVSEIHQPTMFQENNIKDFFKESKWLIVGNPVLYPVHVSIPEFTGLSLSTRALQGIGFKFFFYLC